MEWRGSRSFQHTQGKAFKVPHSEKIKRWHTARSSFYTLIGILLVLVLFFANLMRKVKNMLSPMHPKVTTRLRTTTLHTRGSVLLLYGPSYISGPVFMALSSHCILTTNLSVVDDQWQAYLMHPQALWWTHYKSKSENNRKRKSWVRSLTHSTSGVEGHAGAPGWD
jgi:hypothetical protein